LLLIQSISHSRGLIQKSIVFLSRQALSLVDPRAVSAKLCSLLSDITVMLHAGSHVDCLYVGENAGIQRIKCA